MIVQSLHPQRTAIVQSLHSLRTAIVQSLHSLRTAIVQSLHPLRTMIVQSLHPPRTAIVQSLHPLRTAIVRSWHQEFDPSMSVFYSPAPVQRLAFNLDEADAWKERNATGREEAGRKEGGGGGTLRSVGRDVIFMFTLEYFGIIYLLAIHFMILLRKLLIEHTKIQFVYFVSKLNCFK